MESYSCNVSDAVAHYKQTLEKSVKQSDKHMDGFLRVFRTRLESMGMKVVEKHKAVVNGGILNKRWDLVGTNSKRHLALEFKSISSSRFGRLYHSRVEEAIGAGMDAKAKNKNIELGYLIVLDNDDEQAHKHHNKIRRFCKAICNDYKIYDSAMAIEISPHGFEYLYNDFDSFMSKFDYKPVVQKLFGWMKKDD